MIYRILFALEPPKSIDFTNKKDPKKGQFVNGGNNAFYIEPFITTLKLQLMNKDSAKLVYMLNKWALKYIA